MPPDSTPPAVAARYRATRFLLSAHQLSQLPPDQCREVALAGRSNAGKSSVLNMLTGQKKLARISKTPGRTQLINYFEIAPERYLVDLPGYGYAKTPPAMRQHWGRVLQEYFARRQSLCGLLLIMDIRHPLTTLDQQMLQWCRVRHLKVGVLLSKADKLKRGPALNTVQQVRKQLNQAHPQAETILFSAVDGRGTTAALELLERWLFAQDAVESTA